MTESEKENVRRLIEAWYRKSRTVMYEFSVDFDTDGKELEKEKAEWEALFGL